MAQVMGLISGKILLGQLSCPFYQDSVDLAERTLHPAEGNTFRNRLVNSGRLNQTTVMSKFGLGPI